eukprot:CAMPEP_0117615926 /NCGR_PEP_ID=MMETSP0784-20121206/84785_1 /TAXON_ID=39447 /ORGANISM="" /LENGTH=74 /DNA_ID=CAMNT_0005419665 /DNA_START=287 /DNA_END=511 /DNA_ORIENTATION=-
MGRTGAGAFTAIAAPQSGAKPVDASAFAPPCAGAGADAPASANVAKTTDAPRFADSSSIGPPGNKSAAVLCGGG